MFFRRRSTQAEYFDFPRDEAEIIAGFRDLDRLNRFFRFAHPFTSRIPPWLGQDSCKRLEILDVGAGSGLLGEQLSAWAKRRGWNWYFTNLDANPIAARLYSGQRRVVGSALELPFEDDRFDLVVASQMTHHLTEEQIVQHWREAWRVGRKGIFICDLHRNVGLYSMLLLGNHVLGIGEAIRDDGLISVRRGFHLNEWRELSRRAEIPAQVSLYYGTRIILQARKASR